MKKRKTKPRHFTVTMSNGSVISFDSADSPDSLHGNPVPKLPFRLCDEDEPRITESRCSVCKAPVCFEHVDYEQFGKVCEDCEK